MYNKLLHERTGQNKNVFSFQNCKDFPPVQEEHSICNLYLKPRYSWEKSVDSQSNMGAQWEWLHLTLFIIHTQKTDGMTTVN